MNLEYVIRVHYPLKSGRMVLRTDRNWDRDLEASAVSSDHEVHEFRFHSGDAYHYYKPCIVDHGLHWSRGANYLAIGNHAGGSAIYPHFFSADHGEVSAPLTLHSSALGREVVARVYQPPGYWENTLKKYPVLYMHDGKNLFFPEEAFSGQEWRVDETMGLLDAMSLVDKVLIVGIYAGDRMSEYTKPGYEAYGRCLVSELMPFLSQRYRILDGPERTAVMGSSLGGVVSFYLAWQYPEHIGKAACLSSTFTYRDDLMERVADEPKRNLMLYLDSGWPRDNYEATRSMRDLLLWRGFRPGQDLHYLAFPGALHNEGAWATRFHIPFQLFFGKTPRLAGL